MSVNVCSNDNNIFKFSQKTHLKIKRKLYTYIAHIAHKYFNKLHLVFSQEYSFVWSDIFHVILTAYPPIFPGLLFSLKTIQQRAKNVNHGVTCFAIVVSRNRLWFDGNRNIEAMFNLNFKLQL